MAQPDAKPFKSFQTHLDGGSTFVFSEDYATIESPVVISVPGRKLTNDDREFRVDLQKYWLSINVPKNLRYAFRSLDECGRKIAGEYPFCDHYVFSDPKTDKQFDYYIYVGNWP